MSNAGTVHAIYEAFGRGDVAAILERLDEAVEWEAAAPVPEVPWLQHRRGKEAAAGFFASMAPLRVDRFAPHTLFESGDKVFVLIDFAATTAGKSYTFPNNGHLWQFGADGRVRRFDHVTDTARMIRMAQGA
jgi:ketosteroid isomerase-like protein